MLKIIPNIIQLAHKFCEKEALLRLILPLDVMMFMICLHRTYYIYRYVRLLILDFLTGLASAAQGCLVSFVI